jgi:acetoin utilization deacetylase AcuC-like enzyme
LQRVAVVDFDVHHGNGTQDALAGDPDCLFASIHQWPGWPGSGGPNDAAPSNVINAGVRPFAPREVWRRSFEALVERVAAFGPDLIIVSAGFDAHVDEPASLQVDQQLEAEDFAWATRAVVAAASGSARGRVVSSLEGGYDLEALGRSALAHVRALQGV